MSPAPLCSILKLQKLCRGFPLGISHCGQKIENPLLLLGQYSDDELEDSVERVHDATVDSSLANNNEQLDGSPHGGHKNTNVKSDADTVIQTVNQQCTEKDACASDVINENECGEVVASDSTPSVGLHKQSDSSMQASGMVSSELHATTGDVSSQWKMILHEESNQYYYWNTETGETSWEVPQVLAQTAGVSFDQQIYATGYGESGPVGTFGSNLVAQSIITGPDNLTFQKTVDDIGHQTDDLSDRYISEDPESKPLGDSSDQSEYQRTSALYSLPFHEELADPGNLSENVLANSDNGATIDLPARLLEQSERLLEKLRSLEKSHGNLPSHEQISKHILEVEIRHSDIKALISNASSLLLFWVHTEKQLKLLEDRINNEIYELAKFAVMDDATATKQNYLEEKEKSEDSIAGEFEDSEREGERACSGKAADADESAGVNGGGSESHDGRDSVRKSDVTALDETIVETNLPVVDDVDMDVDMEVEESGPAPAVPHIGESTSNIIDQAEQPDPHTDDSVPPPPGEEWIPPPPPESEEVPPPPPDTDNDLIPPIVASEVHGLSYMPPQSYTQQSATYAAQYSISYPGTNYQYYGNVANNLYYGPIDGSQGSFYYGTVSGTSSESAPGIANGVEAYYNFKEGTAPLFPVVGSAESFLHHTAVGSVNHSANNVQPTDASTANNHIIDGSAKMFSSRIPSTSSTSQVKESIPGSSQVADVVMGVANSNVTAKGQSKVTRPKKRSIAVAVASTLRSNKKVSSLVDKWKAAKEELNESEEEEPENAYEILERKRQREIEEWKARQIATGEAKDNANFQPLGGDWREKVKRKRQQAAREAAKSAVDHQKDEKQQQPQKPDLTKISADLPSGWQAYWDESTKKVYYGNTITSQTSWSRPTTSSN